MRPSARLVGGVVLALVAGAPTGARAQGNRWERQVRDQLARAVAALQRKGAERAELTRTGTLNAEESEAFTVTLEAGRAYQIIGVCDDDCTGLGLVLGNAAKSEVAVDRASEHFPLLRFTPPATMTYRVKVTMAACQMNPCWYGVAVYRQ